MHYITEIGLTSRFFQVYHSYHTVYHENSGTLPLSNLNLNIHTDNQALVYILNNQTVKSNVYCLKLFVLNCMRYSILIRAHHIGISQALRTDGVICYLADR